MSNPGSGFMKGAFNSHPPHKVHTRGSYGARSSSQSFFVQTEEPQAEVRERHQNQKLQQQQLQQQQQEQLDSEKVLANLKNTLENSK